jgi:hypothetical protein
MERKMSHYVASVPANGGNNSTIKSPTFYDKVKNHNDTWAYDLEEELMLSDRIDE